MRAPSARGEGEGGRPGPSAPGHGSQMSRSGVLEGCAARPCPKTRLQVDLPRLFLDLKSLRCADAQCDDSGGWCMRLAEHAANATRSISCAATVSNGTPRTRHGWLSSPITGLSVDGVECLHALGQLCLGAGLVRVCVGHAPWDGWQGRWLGQGGLEVGVAVRVGERGVYP